MQLDENPYLQPEEPAPPEQPEQPYPQTYQQQPYQQPYQQQPYQQQPYQQQPYQQQPYQQQLYQPTYQQPYPQRNYYGARPNKAFGMAKAFSIVSFITGLISLFSALSGMLSLFVSLTNTSTLLSSSDVLSMVSSAVMFAVPGLVFGIIALIKKTRLLPMAIIGVIMNGSMAAVTLIRILFESIL